MKDEKRGILQSLKLFTIDIKKKKIKKSLVPIGLVFYLKKNRMALRHAPFYKKKLGVHTHMTQVHVGWVTADEC
jgi:hypothetical protein